MQGIKAETNADQGRMSSERQAGKSPVAMDRTTTRPAGSRPKRASANGRGRAAKAWESDRELVDQILAGSREHFD